MDTSKDKKDDEGKIIYPREGKGDIYQPGDKFPAKNTTLGGLIRFMGTKCFIGGKS